MADFAALMRPHLEGALESGESLEGICAATQQSTFKGRSIALGITDRRLMLAPLDRRGRPDGEIVSITPQDVADAEAGGAGGGWANVATRSWTRRPSPSNSRRPAARSTSST